MRGAYQNNEKTWSCFVLPRVGVFKKLKPFSGFVPVLPMPPQKIPPLYMWIYKIASLTHPAYPGVQHAHTYTHTQ